MADYNELLVHTESAEPGAELLGSRFGRSPGGRGSLRLAKTLEQCRYAFGWLGTMTNPVLDSIDIDAQLFLGTACYRIKKAYSLDITAIASITLVRHNNVIEGALLRAATG